MSTLFPSGMFLFSIHFHCFMFNLYTVLSLKVNMSDFLESMKKMKKSVSGDTLIGYEAWNQKFGESAP